MTHKKRLIKTNRIHLIFALRSVLSDLPAFASIEDWCMVAERAFANIGYSTYCHKSAQVGLFEHSKRYGERRRFEKALYHCDLQYDIAILNRDTNDPSGVSTDPLFPRKDYWVFRNVGGNADEKSIDLAQLEKCYKEYAHIQLDLQYVLSSDGHKCLSAPELFIEEFFIRNGIDHIKEGDTDKVTGKRLTVYPFDEELNSGRRSKEADWIISLEGSDVFVEFFEGRMDAKYLKNVEIKREICARNDLRLIELWRGNLAAEKLSEIFEDFL